MNFSDSADGDLYQQLSHEFYITVCHINLVEQKTKILQCYKFFFIWVEVVYLKLKLDFTVLRTAHCFKNGT
jgi:hypothetical protein